MHRYLWHAIQSIGDSSHTQSFMVVIPSQEQIRVVCGILSGITTYLQLWHQN